MVLLAEALPPWLQISPPLAGNKSPPLHLPPPAGFALCRDPPAQGEQRVHPPWVLLLLSIPAVFLSLPWWGITVLNPALFLSLSSSFGHTCRTSGEMQKSGWAFCVRERVLGKMGDEERNLIPVVSQKTFSYLQRQKPLFVSIPN